MSLPSLPNKTTLYQISLLFMGALCCRGKFALTVCFDGETGDFHSHCLSKEDFATGKCKHIHRKQSKPGTGKPFIKVQIRKDASGKINSEQRTKQPVGDRLNAEFCIFADTESYQLHSSTVGASHNGTSLCISSKPSGTAGLAADRHVARIRGWVPWCYRRSESEHQVRNINSKIKRVINSGEEKD